MPDGLPDGAPAWLVAWAKSLDTTALAAVMRESAWAYPVANLLHVLGIALLVGAIVALDLRLLGIRRRAVSAAGAAALLVPIAATGVAVAVPTGVLLFLAETVPLATHWLMQVKMLLVAAGLANVIAFHLVWRRRLHTWDEDTPPLGRLQALLSTGIWVGVLGCGRLLAYT